MRESQKLPIFEMAGGSYSDTHRMFSQMIMSKGVIKVVFCITFLKLPEILGR